MRFQVSADSTAAPERLWRSVAEVQRWPEVLPTFATVRLSDGSPVPEGVGARYDVRQPGLLPSVYEVTEWIAGESFTWCARSPGIRTIATHRVGPGEQGSRLELSLEWRGPLAPLVGRLLGGRALRMIGLEARRLTEVAGSGG